MGHLSMWAVFQVITVPLILCKVSFLVDVIIVSTVYLFLAAYGIYKKRYKELKVPGCRWTEWISCLAAAATVIFLSVMAYRLQLTNADDSRFVVNAVDTVRTNRMLLTDVNTGNEIFSFIGDLYKDVISPWSVYAAYLSKLTGIGAAAMMHTFLPPVLLLLMGGFYWLIAGELFDTVIYRSVFVCLAVIIFIYGNYSIYGVETFALTRIWQGKAVLAAVGVPAMVYALFRIYKCVPIRETWRKKVPYTSEAKGTFAFLFLAVFATALLSSMSYFLTTFLVACFGLVYGICKKDLRTALLMFGGGFINVIYLTLSFFLH